MKREDLENFTIHILRDIGRKVGVRGASTLVKKDLIQEILEVNSGKKQPYFTTKGRPAIDSGLGDIVKEIERKEEQIERLKFKKSEKEGLLLKLYLIKNKIDDLLNELINEINLKEAED